MCERNRAFSAAVTWQNNWFRPLLSITKKLQQAIEKSTGTSEGVSSSIMQYKITYVSGYWKLRELLDEKNSRALAV